MVLKLDPLNMVESSTAEFDPAAWAARFHAQTGLVTFQRTGFSVPPLATT